MKILHISDLHIGKIVNGFSMLEDQEYILNQIIDTIENENIETVLISGDVFDRSVAPANAVVLFDNFLSSIAQNDRYIFLIAGNHDSVERLSFGAELFKNKNVYIAKAYKGEIEQIRIQKECGEFVFHLLPYIKPINVKNAFPDEEINSYNDAVNVAISKNFVDTNKINIILSHQFITGSLRSDSEEISIGGMENVDISNYKDFDYVALGHIHSQQTIKRETVAYCGTPLKYSFSECGKEKSLRIIDIQSKNNINIKQIPLIPIKDMRIIKGYYAEIASRENYINTNTNDYVKIELLDEMEIPQALNRLRSIYPNIMEIEYKNTRNKYNNSISVDSPKDTLSPLDFFNQLYELQNNKEMSVEQKQYLESIVQKAWEVEQ